MTPVLAGGVQVLMMVTLTLWLRTVFVQQGWLPLGALALGFSLSNYAEVVVLLWLLRRRLGGLDGYVLLDGFWRILLASLLMTGAIWLLLSRVSMESMWLQLILGGLTGAVVYLFASWLLRVQEVKQIMHYGRNRLSRN